MTFGLKKWFNLQHTSNFCKLIPGDIFLEFFQKQFAGKFLAMHHRSRSLTFFNHIFVAKNRPADTKRHLWQPFWTQKSKTRLISYFFSAKSFGSEIISEG
jgi:hypothetical protein